ncbi:tape measure protein [Pseudomonas sp. B26140]|uniref:tape measure protein n=1 Tax=Pseudomonas sp. B26140 TaxID=3235112 RepID=UPI00378385ED
MADADVQGMLIRIEATTAQLRRELASADQLVGQTAGSIDRGLGKVDSAFDRTAQKAQVAGNLMRGAFATIAGAGLIGGLIKQADSYGQIADRMRAATSSSAEYQLVQQHLLTTAQETYRPLQEAQELYIRTADVMKSLGFNTQQTLAITDSFSYLLVTNAASADKGATALDAYSKALQTGKIEADGWVSIVTAMPTVTAAVAAATGKTTEEIRKLGVEGKLALSDLNKGFEQTVAANREAAAQMSVSVTDALNNISNAISAYIGEANESSGATGELASVLDIVAKNIDVVAAAVAGLLAAGATGYFLKFSVAAWSSAKAMVAEAAATRDAAAAKVENSAAAAAMAASYATEMSAIVANARATEESAVAKVRSLQVSRDQLAYTAALAKDTQEEARYTAALAATELELAASKKAATQAGIQLGTALNAETAALIKDTAATEAAATAKRNLAGASTLAGRAGSGLLALLGGPAGIAALAVGAGIAFLTMRDSTDQAAISLDEMKAPLDQVIAKFKALNEDQRKAALVRWGEAQAKAAKDVASEFGNLAASIRAATVDPSQARLGGYSVQLKEYSELIARLKEAQANGQSLTPILEGLRGKGGIDDAQINSWIKQAGAVSDAGGVLKEVTLKLNEQTGALATNTAETNVNNAAKAGMSAAGTTYLEALQKQLEGLQDGGDATKIANRYIEKHADLTETDKVAILSAASAIEANKEATKRATAATKGGNSAAKEAATEAKNQTKALTDLKAQADIAIASAAGLAAAYLAGTDKSREFSLQQKVEEALLKTGATARAEVIAKLTAERDAQDKLAVSKSAYDLGKETADLIAQAKATLMGADALAAYNAEKALTIALAGKNIEVGSEEYKQMLAATEAQKEALKLVQQAGSAGGIMDRLYPEAKLLKDYTADQEALNAAMALYPENAASYQDALAKLGNEYEVNRSKATIWGQMTEGAIDRIDEAFASAWGNIGSGAESLWDNLKKGFKQTLGEIAHMLTTKPLLASISNWLSGTDNGQGLSSIWGKLLGSATGQGGSAGDANGWGGMVSLGKNLYSAWSNLTGVGSSIASGYASGGIGGAIQGGAGYYGNMLSNIGSTLSNGFSSLVSTFTGATAAQTAATIGAQGVTSAVLSGAVTEGATAIGAQFTTGVATTTAATYAAAEAGAAATAASLGGQISAAMSSAAAMWPLAVIMGMYQSGKLYDAGVRPDASEMFASGGSTALGKASMIPQTLQSKAFEITDGINSKLVGGKLAAIISGSTLHQAVWGAVGKKLFGGAWETKDGGISLGVENGEFDPQQYIYQKKKGGLFSSSKKRTRYSDLDAETESALGAAYNDKLLNSMGLFSALGVQLSESVFDGLNVAATKISTQGKTPEAIQEELDKWFSGLGDSAVSAINAATNSGLENYNFETLTTFVNDLYSVNDSFDMLGLKLYDVSVSTGFMAEQLISMAGGLEALKAGESSFFENFYTDTEKADYALSTVNKQFEAMGVKLPGTRDAYRDMVEALDLTTESGRQMYVTLTSLSGNAAQAYSILEQRADAAAAAVQAMSEQLIGVAGNAQSALQRAISAQQKATTEAYNARVTSLNDMVSTATESVSGLTSVGNDLGAALKALRGDSDDAVKMLRAQAQATLQSALATARSGGSLSGFTGLSDALDTVSSNNTDLYGSMEDFARDQGRTANVVAELNGINGKQLTTAEKSLKGLETQIELAKAAYDAQMAQFDSQLAFAQAQMDALNGVDNSVMGVTAAINAMNLAVVAALAGITGKASDGTSTNNGTLIDSVYQSLLGREADAAGKDYWQGQLASGAISYDQLAQAIANAAKEKGQAIKVPGYATGGLIAGPGNGTSDSIFARLSNGEYVMNADSVRMFGTGLLDQMNAGLIPAFATGGGIGESGPQLEVTGPSRIFNANQTASMLRGGGDNAALLSELKQMREENKSQRFQIAKTNQQVASLLQKWDTEGTPKERDYAL